VHYDLVCHECTFENLIEKIMSFSREMTMLLYSL